MFMKIKELLENSEFGKSLEYLRNIMEFGIFGRFWKSLEIWKFN